MRKKSLQILLLEDEPLLRDLLALFLGNHGFRVFAGGSLQEAEIILEILGWTAVDLVLADANLNRDPAKLDGYAFHASWRKRYPVPPFVFMRGLPNLPQLPEPEGSLAIHILKPFSPSLLIHHIKTILQGHSG